MKKKLSRTKQCAKCPWKVSTNPHQIPNGYCVKKHRALQKTIARPGVLDFSETRAMACHESEVGDEMYCIGWLWHQIGPGNNLGLRLQMMRYDLSEVEVFGEQHADLEDTIPK